MTVLDPAVTWYATSHRCPLCGAQVASNGMLDELPPEDSAGLFAFACVNEACGWRESKSLGPSGNLWGWR